MGNLELRAGSANFFNGHGSRRFLVRNSGWVFRSGQIFDSFYITSDWFSPGQGFALVRGVEGCERDQHAGRG